MLSHVIYMVINQTYLINALCTRNLHLCNFPNNLKKKKSNISVLCWYLGLRSGTELLLFNSMFEFNRNVYNV